MPEDVSQSQKRGAPPRVGRATRRGRIALLIALVVLGGPSLAAAAALPADLEQSLTYVPATMDRSEASAAQMPAGAFCPPRRSSPVTQVAAFAASILLAGLASRRRPERI